MRLLRLWMAATTPGKTLLCYGYDYFLPNLFVRTHHSHTYTTHSHHTTIHIPPFIYNPSHTTTHTHTPLPTTTIHHSHCRVVAFLSAGIQQGVELFVDGGADTFGIGHLKSASDGDEGGTVFQQVLLIGVVSCGLFYCVFYWVFYCGCFIVDVLLWCCFLDYLEDHHQKTWNRFGTCILMTCVSLFILNAKPLIDQKRSMSI